ENKIWLKCLKTESWISHNQARARAINQDDNIIKSTYRAVYALSCLKLVFDYASGTQNGGLKVFLVICLHGTG
ncbi:hypothetical protein ACBQ19_22530, partial [Hafnia alvei]